MPRTIHSMAQEALDAQSACNLSGIVLAFARIVEDMRGPLGFDTPRCNTHPICRLFAEQILHLTTAGRDPHETYADASEECERLAAMHRAVTPEALATELMKPHPFAGDTHPALTAFLNEDNARGLPCEVCGGLPCREGCRP